VTDKFELVPVDAFLTHRKEFFVIDDVEQYKRVTVKLHAGGIVLRDRVYGSQLKTKKQQATRAGDLLVAEIDAKVGGVGIVPPELAGAIVSSHYFLYEIEETICHPKYLAFYIRSGAVERQFQEFVQGSTNYASVRAHHTLELQIPLPPLDEQRCIVARVEELAALIEEAQGLRVKAHDTVAALRRAMLFNPKVETTPTPMSELVRLRKPDVSVQPDVVYRFAGVYSFGKGVFHSATRTGSDTSYQRLTALSPGNFVYPKLMAWEGAFGIVPPELGGFVVSPEFPVFEVDESKVLPETLDIYFRSPSTWGIISQISAGTNVRRRRLHPSSFLKFKFPLPPLPVQMKLREIGNEFAHLDDLQVATQAELDALLPSVLDRAFKGEL